MFTNFVSVKTTAFVQIIRNFSISCIMEQIQWDLQVLGCLKP